MIKGVSGIVISGCLVAIVALTTYFLYQPSSITVARRFSDASVKEIAGYRAWTKVNRTPEMGRGTTYFRTYLPYDVKLK